MTKLTGTIINDCADDNSRVRQELRFNSLFGVQPIFLGVDSYSPVEAAGNLLDVLDILTNFPLADKDRENIVLVNVAPRGEDVQEKWDNGTPFCYFRLGKTLVVCAYDGQCLALARNLGVVHEVELLDVPTVTNDAVTRGELTLGEASKINDSQFRSLEFLPLAAYWLWQGKKLPSQTLSLSELPGAKGLVWLVDNFDDVKTTLLPEDVGFKDGKKVVLANGQTALCHRRLADVPKGVTAVTIGSSGYGQHRFLEVVIGHRGKAGSAHSLAAGEPVLSSKHKVN
jgi:hypothetical protein